MDLLTATLRTEDIVAQLAAPTLVERDRATATALAFGAPVAARLLDGVDALAPVDKGRRLWTFHGLHMRRAAQRLRDPRPVELRHRGTLGEAIAILAAEAGVPVAEPLAGAALPVDVDLRGVTLLQALDAVCAAAGARGAQGRRGALATEAEPLPPFPTAYDGVWRVRAVEARVERVTDFVATRARATVRLQVDWEWPVASVGPPRLTLAGPGRVEEPVAHGAGAEIVVGLDDVGGDGPLRLRGELEAVFALDHEELRITPGGGEVEAHGLAVRIERQDDAGCVLRVEPRAELRARGDAGLVGVPGSVLCLGASGREVLVSVHRIRSVGVASEAWGVRPPDDFGPIAELRLRAAARLESRRIALDLAIPRP